MSDLKILKVGALSLRVCVPDNVSATDIEAAANLACPCGTALGWKVAAADSKSLGDCDPRIVCAEDPSRVHVVLDA